MKFIVIFAITLGVVMGAPSANTRIPAGKATTNTASTATANSATNTLNAATPSVQFDTRDPNQSLLRSRLSFVNADGSLLDIDDLDDIDFVTTDLSGRQLTVQAKETPIPIANRANAKSSNIGTATQTAQRTVDVITFSDSGEIDDINDLDDDDFPFFSTVSRNPFVSRTNSLRVVQPSSVFSPVIRSPVRQVSRKPSQIQISQNSLRSTPTCTCVPQRETFTQFQPAVTPARQFFQFMGFPQQHSINRFVEPTRNFGNVVSAAQFPGFHFVFDD